MVLEKLFAQSALERLHIVFNHCSKVRYAGVTTFTKTKPQIHLSTTDALVDEKVCISVSGLQEGQNVTLQTFVDEGSKSFGSCGHYVADRDGNVNLFKHQCHGGTFDGLEPMGLFWSMQSLPGQRPRRILNTDITRPFDVQIALHPNHVDFKDLPWPGCHTSLASCHFYQRFMSPEVNVIPVNEDGIVGTFYIPDGEGPFPTVIDMFGIAPFSPGHRSSLLASNGIASFNLTYIGHQGMNSPDELDFMYFLKAFDWLSRHPKVNPKALGGIGSCIGAAYLSLIVWKRPNLRCFVSINSPTRPAGPSQMVEGEIVEEGGPWRWDLRQEIEGAQAWRPMSKVEDKIPSLPYWRHGAKVLQIQGEDDQCVDPDCLRASHEVIPPQFRDNVEFLSYPGAGHILEPPYMPLCRMNYNSVFDSMLFWGGQPKPHARAQVDSWPRIVEFFKKNLMDNQGLTVS